MKPRKFKYAVRSTGLDTTYLIDELFFKKLSEARRFVREEMDGEFGASHFEIENVNTGRVLSSLTRVLPDARHADAETRLALAIRAMKQATLAVYIGREISITTILESALDSLGVPGGTLKDEA